jgi:hypothetical protein
MRLFDWLRRKKPRIEHRDEEYMIRLHHDNGSTVEIHVSERMLKFIRNNLGRDEIYVQGKLAVNLRHYALLLVDPKD